MHTYIYIYIYIFYIVVTKLLKVETFTYVTGPAKRDQVGTCTTKYTLSQNGEYLEFCAQYLVSVSYNMLPIKLCIVHINFTSIALADQ